MRKLKLTNAVSEKVKYSLRSVTGAKPTVMKIRKILPGSSRTFSNWKSGSGTPGKNLSAPL